MVIAMFTTVGLWFTGAGQGFIIFYGDKGCGFYACRFKIVVAVLVNPQWCAANEVDSLGFYMGLNVLSFFRFPLSFFMKINTMGD